MRQKSIAAGVAPASPASGGVKVGWLVAGASPDEPLVDFPGNQAPAPLPARLAAALDRPAIERAVLTRQPALLVFEDGDPARPIVLSLLRGESSAFADLVVGDAPGRAEARVDGERVVIEGKDEVVLKCGEASITLRKDGRVVVRGRYVEAAATGTNRIRGGVVKIN